MLLKEQPQGLAPHAERGATTSLRAADGNHLGALNGIAPRPVGVAHGDNAHVICTSQRPRQMAQRRNTPVLSVRAEARHDEADSHRRASTITQSASPPLRGSLPTGFLLSL